MKYLQTNCLSSCPIWIQTPLLHPTFCYQRLASHPVKVASIFFDVKFWLSPSWQVNTISCSYWCLWSPVAVADRLSSKQTQRIVLDGESSSFVSVTSRVPQGSILGPLLFIILWTLSLIYLYPQEPNLPYMQTIFYFTKLWNPPVMFSFFNKT